MSLSDSEEYNFFLKTSSSKNDLQTLTKQSLFLLNLENSKNSKNSNFPENESGTATSLTGNSTPDVSSSSSSLASYDSQSEDYKELSKFYRGNKNPSTSNSSIATLVQKLASSTSTLNLQPKALQNPSIFDSSPSANEKLLLKTPPNELDQTPRKIKSSLKLPGLTRSKSMPSTAPKTVRFSTVLTRVKTFNEHAKPSSISLDNSPESSSPNEDEYYETFSSPKAFFDLKNQLNSSDDSDDSEEDYFTYKSSLQRAKWILKCLNFNLLSFHQRLNSSHVKLGSLSIIDNSKLIGTVDVSNIAFEKYVEIKFTTDDWKSIYLVTGKYDRSIDSTTDRFNFEINLNQSLLLSDKKALLSPQKKEKTVSVGLCVRYVAGGSQIFYDNNNSQNYKFELINQQRIRKSKSMGSSLLSPSHRRNISGVPSFTIDNFSNAEINTSPSKSTNYTTSTRYFSDDTDYFNKPSIYSSTMFKSWDSKGSSTPLSSMTNSSSTSVESAISNASTTTSLASSSFGTISSSPITTASTTSSTTTSTTTNSNNTNKTVSASSNFGITSKNPTSYNEFLSKYCFFKSEDPRNDFNNTETVTIK